MRIEILATGQRAHAPLEILEGAAAQRKEAALHRKAALELAKGRIAASGEPPVLHMPPPE